MRKTTSIFAILLVGMSFLAMSFTKTPSLLGASSMVASTVESTDNREKEPQPAPVVSRLVVTTYTEKCGISLIMCLEPAPQLEVSLSGTFEYLSAALNNDKTPARLMHSL